MSSIANIRSIFVNGYQAAHNGAAEGAKVSAVLVSAIVNGGQEASKGAAKGAIIGAGLVSAFVGFGFAFNLLEVGARAIGLEPRWPIYLESDCQLPQFRDLSCCNQPPMFDSLTSLAVYTISATTMCGMLVGSVSGAARSVFRE
jgi:hypothetical protein